MKLKPRKIRLTCPSCNLNSSLTRDLSITLGGLCHSPGPPSTEVPEHQANKATEFEGVCVTLHGFCHRGLAQSSVASLEAKGKQPGGTAGHTETCTAALGPTALCWRMERTRGQRTKGSLQVEGVHGEVMALLKSFIREKFRL